MENWYLLVVEDDPDGQEVVKRMLLHHNITFDPAHTGEEAVEMLGSGHYTGVIIDLALPGIDGWQVIQTIQSNPATAHLPCVAMTAYHSAEVAIEAINAGFKAYFPKPLEATSFVRELVNVF
jgi:CheY-like chemotaxis protein